MQTTLRLFLSLLTACVLVGCTTAWKHEPGDFRDDAFDVAIVPGCPSQEDGSVSDCQWRRALWAATLYEQGSVKNFVTSGGAVYNRYIEAEALAEALVVLGVPRTRIVLEPHALHSDENAAFSLRIIERRGWQSIAVVSESVHAVLIDKILAKWGVASVALPVDRSAVKRQVEAGMPTVRTRQVPDERWLALEQRHALRTAELGYTRGASVPLYIRRALTPGATSPLIAEPPELGPR